MPGQSIKEEKRDEHVWGIHYVLAVLTSPSINIHHLGERIVPSWALTKQTKERALGPVEANILETA